MGTKLTPLDLRQLDDGLWEVLADFKYRFNSGELVVVPDGFITDCQSIPRLAWSIVGHPVDDYAEAGVVHDWLYQYPDDCLLEGAKVRSRARVDQMFLEVNIDEGCTWRQRTVKHWVVRAFGWVPWRRYRKADADREG